MIATMDYRKLPPIAASSKGLKASPIGTILCLPVQVKEKEDAAENGNKAPTHGKGKISTAIYTMPKQDLTESLVKGNIVQTSHELVRETPIEVNPLHELPQPGSFAVINGKSHSIEQGIDELGKILAEVINSLGKGGVNDSGNGSKSSALRRNLFMASKCYW
ncbi:hypothetical protein ACH5RR_040851 [Cinchona calisaya]|uniref:Uncharacterized protein n=1 Tax=Cinchona calisaya TaxID=153742 RepID=A0ABD2XSJ1_9GENT